MGYLQDFEQKLSAECYQNEPPFCTAACPFGLDVKELVKKWKKGRFNAAYRTFQNTVGFPGIVAAACPHPCEEVCLRCGKDGAVSLHRLEQATLAHASRQNPNAYNMPSKGKCIAVIGAGISGLACTLFLSNKKYEVTVFEKSDRIGGRLWQELPPEVFLTDIERQFRHETYELRTNAEVRNLEELSDFDAIYIATGSQGEQFGLELSGSGACATGRPGVFLGGSVLGKDTIEALADGLVASRAVERYLKTGTMNHPSEQVDTKLCMDLTSLEEVPSVVLAEGEIYTEKEAVFEAERCVLCSCDACMRECDLMRLFEKNPRRIYEEVYITIHPGTLSRDGTWATRLISTCSQCGLCKEVCPRRIDIGKFFLQSHQTMREKGAMPWVFHDYWLRDMYFSNGEASLCKVPPGTEGKTRYVFFPGCQMGASDPAYVERSYAWLRRMEPATGLWLHCCGAPAKWAGDRKLHEQATGAIREEWERLGKPELIFGCSTCRQMFDTHLPEISGSFLYEKMAAWGLEIDSVPADTYSVFDPCSSREYPELQQSIRQLAGAAGIVLDPLSHEGRNARCCGYGGQTQIAAPQYAREVAMDRIGEKEITYIAYCVNCRDTFAAQQKPAVHILDLVFGLRSADAQPPDLSERWENRRELKRRMLAELGEEIMAKEKKRILYIEEVLKQKLSAGMILESDMEEVVDWCEETGHKLKNPANGGFTGHKKIQNMTYWAEYRPEGDGFRLINGYAHRMCLEEDLKCQEEK